MSLHGSQGFLNSKFESRNSKQIRNPNNPMFQTRSPDGLHLIDSPLAAGLEDFDFYHSDLFRI
ncbi:MAG: hypothetical protein C4530_16995, partial [Desulfobacteraceae bacterium]